MNLKIWEIYNKNYKKLIAIPLIVIVIFSIYLFYNKTTKGYFIDKDISLKGGVSASIYTSEEINIKEVENNLETALNVADISVRELVEPISSKVIGYDVKIGEELNQDLIKENLQKEFKTNLTAENFSLGIQGSSLSASFFNDAIITLLFAFILMAAVVFYYFRSPLPSFTIIFSTMADVVCTLGLMSLLGLKLSSASIGALLIIIGYSTDSDILFSTNIIKRSKEGEFRERITKSFKTAATMTITAFLVYLAMLVFSNISVIKEIAVVLLLGLIFDIINTWLFTANIQRMWVERKR